MRFSAFLAVAGLAACAAAEVTHFSADIDGVQSGSGSPAVGNLTGQYDAVANSFSFSWSISDDLIGSPSFPGSHIHRAPPGSNGPVVFAFNDPDGTWPLIGSAVWSGLSADDVTDLFAGNLYVNFHTTQFPGGEVRGQILLVPAPQGAGLVLLGALGIVSRRRA
ncbi:MAG: CHRD domain-containing protein [Phycisphaerales bacterium]